MHRPVLAGKDDVDEIGKEKGQRECKATPYNNFFPNQQLRRTSGEEHMMKLNIQGKIV